MVFARGLLASAAYLIFASNVLAQDAEQEPPPPESLTTTTPTGTYIPSDGALSLSATTNIPFYSSGHPQCATLISCQGLGSATVTTITTTIYGLKPSVTTVTITPTVVKTEGTNTVYVVPPASDVGRATITVYLSRGQTLTETMEATPAPGAPVTVYIFPGGDEPTKTVYVTSTLPYGHGGTSTIYIGPGQYLPGITPTVTVIPPDTAFIEPSSVCPPPHTVTILKQPEPVAPVNVTKPDGSIEKRPASKFPCSSDDLHPCRGTQLVPWTVFTCNFGGSRRMDGSTYPNAWTKAVNYDSDTILTVTDSWYQAEHWEIKLDGKVLGETKEDGFKNNMLSCTTNGDECIAKGFSHGSFLIPKGSHDLEISWIKGPLTYSGGWKWTHGYGVYRFDRLCRCDHDEL